MNCNTVEKYLYLFRNGELSEREKMLLDEHLNACSSCKKLSKELINYKIGIKEIQSHEPVLTNPNQLTNKIMNAVMVDKKNNSQFFIQLLYSHVFRIAASILVILQVAAFLYQNKYIADSLGVLNKNIETSNIQNNASREKYGKECIEQSKTLLADIFGNEDSGLKKQAITISRKLSQEEIETYALQICEYSYQIQKTGNKKLKKELLTNLLINELNSRL